jgi:putative transposase
MSSARISRSREVEFRYPRDLANAYVESYNDKQRRELLNGEVIDSVLEAQILIDDWRVDYNTYRPHQSLAYLTPAEFARRRRLENEPRVSQGGDR